jgi:hypothetical protein
MARVFARGWLSAWVVLLGTVGSAPAFAQEGDIEEDDKSKPEESSGNSKDDGADDYGPEDDEPTQGTAQGGGIHFGLRLGFGFPLGKIGSVGPNDNKLSDFVNGQIPVWVDLGWQASPSLMLGGYLSYGFVLLDGDVRDACDAARKDCSAGDLRFGLQFQYSFSPGRGTDPWLGAGVGYEWLNSRQDDDSVQYRGWEFLFLQGGLDFGGDASTTVWGPFVAFTFAQFQKVHIKNAGIDQTADIDSKAMHDWLFVGIRGALR